MKKLFFAFVILLCMANRIYSQTISIDKSFGETGSLIIPNSGIEFVDFDAQGNIFVLGTGNGGYPAISKTDANGVIDQTFGTDGTVALNEYTSITGQNYGIKVTDDNKIVIIFKVESCGFAGCDQPKVVILRLNENGTVDESFGSNGEITLDATIHIANTESDDFMLIVNYGDPSYILKYNYDGEIDMTFGTDGKTALTGNPTGNKFERFFPASVKVLSDNSIIIAGSDTRDGMGIFTAFCKLTEQGSFIPSFANNGIYNSMSDYYEGIRDTGNPKSFTGIVEDSNGNLLFRGWDRDADEIGQTDENFVNHYFVRSFSANGEPNYNFGENSFYYFSEVWNTYGNILINGKNLLIGNNNEIIILSINNDGTLGDNSGKISFQNFTIDNMIKQNSDKIIIAGIFEIEDDGSTLNKHGLLRLNFPETVPIKTNEISNSFSIFSNLVNNMLIIESGGLKINRVEIVDLSGRTIYKFNDSRNQINVSALSQGIYFVKIKTDKGIITSKFVKK